MSKGLDDIVDRFRDRPREDHHANCIAQHVERHFTSAHVEVLHTFLSLDQLNIDVYVIAPEHNQYKVLLTSGMSSMSMTNDDDQPNFERLRFAELVMLVPPDTVVSPPKLPWMMDLLMQTARFPHIENTWLGLGQTVQATSDRMPYSKSTKYVGVILLRSVILPESFMTIECGSTRINVYNAFPLYRSEFEFKLANGYTKFIELLNSSSQREVVLNDRAPLI